MGMSALGLLVALGGAAVEQGANNRARHKQENLLAGLLKTQGKYSNQAQQKTQSMIDKIAHSTPTKAKANAQSQYQKQINANRAHTAGTLNVPGAVSSAYSSDASKAARGLSSYGKTQAGELASIDAPHLQRIAEANQMLHLREALDPLRMKSHEAEWLARMKMAGIHPDPWLQALGSAMMGYGSSGVGLDHKGLYGKLLDSGAHAPTNPSAYTFDGVIGG